MGFFSRNKPKGPTHSEQPLPENTARLISGSAAEGLKLLGLDESASPQTVIDKLDAFVDDWQQGIRPTGVEIDADDLPYTCGGLWGEQLVRQFGWDWATVTFHEHGDTKAPGILSRDRALAIYPIHFLIGCFRDSTVDCTIALAFNMLVAGKAEGVPANSYTNVMERARRIVPRR